MSLDITFQYPPDLFNLLIETIPLLCKGKQDVVLFFRGAGVESRYLQEVDPALMGKHYIARHLLTRLNERGEPGLRERRELLRRVTSFEQFSTCWEDDRLAAQGRVTQVRELVDVKDSFTRMRLEREAEARQVRELQNVKVAARQRFEQQLDTIRKDLFSLFSAPVPQTRGKELETVLSRLFELYEIRVREPFIVIGDSKEGVVEQIDGVIELKGHLYLAEMKWHQEPLGVEVIAPLLVKVYNRGDVRGVIISASGFTEPAISQCREALSQKVIALCELEEIVHIIEGHGNLLTMLVEKSDHAELDKTPFVRYRAT